MFAKCRALSPLPFPNTPPADREATGSELDLAFSFLQNVAHLFLQLGAALLGVPAQRAGTREWTARWAAAVESLGRLARAARRRSGLNGLRVALQILLPLYSCAPFGFALFEQTRSPPDTVLMSFLCLSRRLRTSCTNCWVECLDAPFRCKRTSSRLTT